MTVTVTIGRTELGLSDLTLADPPYKTAPLEPGGVTIDRTTASAHQVDGEVLVHSRREQATGSLEVVVTGDTAGDVQTNVDALTDALSQTQWTLTVDVDGTTWVYTCDVADYDVGQVTHLWSQRWVRVTASFPRKPSRS